MSTSPLGSQVFWTGELSSLRPAPVTPNLPYCQTISPEGSTRTTRLSAHPVGQFGSLPGGAPVPAIRVRSPTRCASFTPMIEAAETSFGPRPKCQRMFPARSTSITLLLNWSAMRYRVAEPASPPFWRSDSTPASGAVRALCGAVASRAQDPTSATTDRPHVKATQREQNSLWRGRVARAGSDERDDGQAKCARDAAREELSVAYGREDRELRHGRLQRRTHHAPHGRRYGVRLAMV